MSWMESVSRCRACSRESWLDCSMAFIASTSAWGEGSFTQSISILIRPAEVEWAENQSYGNQEGRPSDCWTVFQCPLELNLLWGLLERITFLGISHIDPWTYFSRSFHWLLLAIMLSFFSFLLVYLSQCLSVSWIRRPSPLSSVLIKPGRFYRAHRAPSSRGLSVLKLI